MESRRGFLIERDGSRSEGAVAPERGSLGAFAREQTGDNRLAVVDGGSLSVPGLPRIGWQEVGPLEPVLMPHRARWWLWGSDGAP